MEVILISQLALVFNRLFEHAAIEVKTDGMNESALFVAEEITGSPDFQIFQGDFKAGTQLRKAFNRGQSFLGINLAETNAVTLTAVDTFDGAITITTGTGPSITSSATLPSAHFPVE